MGARVTFGNGSEGYLAGDSGPGIIVIQEWWGLVGHITDVADRFAAEGFTALAPDLYHGVSTTEPDDAMRLMMGMAMDRAAIDIASAATYLRERTQHDSVGTVGFCLGGSLALWSATVSPQITATVGFYPAVPWERLNPQWPNYRGKHAIIHCSEHDGTSAAPGIQAAVAGITSAGGSVVAYDYPGTDHAFFNSDRPEVFSPKDAEEAWKRTIEFFRSHL